MQMTDINIDGVITWIRDWFYTKGEVDSLLANASGGISDYRSYEIIPSAYNTSLNSTITVSVTVKNMTGNPVANEDVSMFYSTPSLNSPIEVIGTTDNNGVATFSNLQMLDLGINDLRVGSEHCQIQVDGWKPITNYKITQSGNVVIQGYYNQDFVAIKFNGYTFSSLSTSWSSISGTSNLMPAEFRTYSNDFIGFHFYAKTEVVMNYNGEIRARVFDGNARSVTLKGYLMYPRI